MKVFESVHLQTMLIVSLGISPSSDSVGPKLAALSHMNLLMLPELVH